MNKAEESQKYAESGYFLGSRNDYTQAKLKFKRATLFNPKNKDAYFSFGNILYRAHKFQEAELEFARASKIDPEFVEAYIHWGNSAFLQGHHDQAIQLYKKVLELSPDDDLALNNWGFGLFSLKNYSEAIMKYVEAIYTESRQNLAYFNLSLLLFHQGNPIEAMKVFQKGMLATPIGFYRLGDLVEIYSLQVTHTEEELSTETCTDEIDYLQRKLAAIKQILELLNAKGTKGPSEEIKQGEEEPQFGISDIIGDSKLMLYCTALYQQLNLMFSQIFFVNESGAIDQNNDLLAKVVSTLKESLALLTNNEEKSFILNSKGVFISHFNRNFENMQQLDQFAQIVAVKAAITRKQDLTKYEASPLNNKVGVIFQNIKKIFKVKGGLFKVEEFAFVDSLVIFLICLTQLNQDSQHKSSDKMVNSLARDTAEALKSCIEWIKKE